MKFTVTPPPSDPPATPPDDAVPSEPITEIGIARRARVAEGRAAATEEENAKLRRQLDELSARFDGKGDLLVEDGEHKDYKCSAMVEGGGKHPIVYVQSKTRTVTCKVCGATLDAFDVLMEFANAERRFSYHLTSLREEVKKLREEREKLLTQRSSLKSQVKRKVARREAAAKDAAADPNEAKAWLKEMTDKLGTEKSGQ